MTDTDGKPIEVNLKIDAKSFVYIGSVGLLLVALSGLLGKEDWATELVYDLGIACLLIVAIEVGLQQFLKRFPQVLESKLDGLQTQRLQAYLKQMLMRELGEPDTSPERRQEIRQELTELNTILTDPAPHRSPGETDP